MSEDPIVVRRVSEWDLRTLFAASGYEARIATGGLMKDIERESHPSPERAHQPLCTRSQIVAYRDFDGTVLVRVHRYLRQDGTLGASGRADPKYILFEGAIYKQA